MWRIVRIAFAILFLMSGGARAFTVDSSPTAISNVSGLWWNSFESGWGANIAHQGNVMFVTIFTYDGFGVPTWFVASNCAVSGSQCTGPLYRVAGGRPVVQPWGGATVNATQAGTVTVNFSDLNNANVNIVVDGVSTTKAMTRQIFGSVQTPSTSDPNRAKTEQLVGGTWSLSYTIISTFTDTYSFTAVQASTSTPGDWFATGTDKFGGLVVGGYSSKLSQWSLLDPGVIIDEFFVFNFNDLNHVSGCYYQINPPGSTNLSRCYDMNGFRSPAKLRTIEGDRAQLEHLKVDAVKSAPVSGPPAPPEAYEMLRRLREAASSR